MELERSAEEVERKRRAKDVEDEEGKWKGTSQKCERRLRFRKNPCEA
jgi:hypothetical protein